MISDEDSDSTSECGSVGSLSSLVQTFFWEKIKDQENCGSRGVGEGV